MQVAKGWWLALLCCGLGCSSSEEGESFDIAAGTLSGKIGGESWSLMAGETNAFLSEEAHWWVDAYAEPIASPCGDNVAASKHHLILHLPKTPGDYTMSLSRNATFVIEAAEPNNLIATRGRLVVDEVTETSVRGGAHIVFDADNEVSGKFQFAVCP